MYIITSLFARKEEFGRMYGRQVLTYPAQFKAYLNKRLRVSFQTTIRHEIVTWFSLNRGLT